MLMFFRGIGRKFRQPPQKLGGYQKMLSGIELFLIALFAWMAVMLLVPAKEGSRIKVLGPFLMLGTRRGVEGIKKLAEKFPRKGIIFFGILSFMALIGTFSLILYNSGFVLKEYLLSSAPPSYAPSPRTILAIPGINPIIPVGYGILGLVVALVLHELFHGIAAHKERLRINGVGLLMFILPIGAYVEVDEEELKKAEPRKKFRVYSSGPGINLAISFACLLILSGMAASIAPVSGIPIVGVVNGTDAANYIKPGDLLVAINGEKVNNPDQFFKIFYKYKPGEVINVTVLRGNEKLSFSIKLMDKYQFYKSPENKGKPFLGVEFISLSSETFTQILKDPFRNFLTYVALPFYRLSPIGYPLSLELKVSNPSLFWPTYNVIYWIFWMNFVLGTANVLPAYPFDGSGMVSSLIESKGKDPKRSLIILSLVVYLAIAFQFVIPWLSRWGVLR